MKISSWSTPRLFFLFAEARSISLTTTPPPPPRVTTTPSPKLHYSDFTTVTFNQNGLCGPIVTKRVRHCKFQNKKVPVKKCNENHLGYHYDVNVTLGSRTKCEDHAIYKTIIPASITNASKRDVALSSYSNARNNLVFFQNKLVIFIESLTTDMNKTAGHYFPHEKPSFSECRVPPGYRRELVSSKYVFQRKGDFDFDFVCTCKRGFQTQATLKGCSRE